MTINSSFSFFIGFSLKEAPIHFISYYSLHFQYYILNTSSEALEKHSRLFLLVSQASPSLFPILHHS